MLNFFVPPQCVQLQLKPQRTVVTLTVWLKTAKLTGFILFFLPENEKRQPCISIDSKLECVQVNTHFQRTVYISEPMNLLITNFRLVTQNRCIMHKYHDQKDFSQSKMDLQSQQIPPANGDAGDREPVVHDVNKPS